MHAARTTGGVALIMLISAAAMTAAGLDEPGARPDMGSSRALIESAAPEPGRAASLAIDLGRLAFLAGRWSQESESGFSEEHWSLPRGNSMMGMFRWLKPDGKPAMFEMLTITQEPGGIYLRLRHYSAALVAKEEKEAPLTLRLASIEGSKAAFAAESGCGNLAGVTYQVTPEKRLKIEVSFLPETKRESLFFDMTAETASRP